MRAIRLLIVFGALAVAGLAQGVPAQAHDWTLWHGCQGPIGCYGNATIYYHHSRLRVCDTKADGNRVRAWYNFADVRILPTAWAPNQGCIRWGAGHAFQVFKVCVERRGCTGWGRW